LSKYGNSHASNITNPWPLGLHDRKKDNQERNDTDSTQPTTPYQDIYTLAQIQTTTVSCISRVCVTSRVQNMDNENKYDKRPRELYNTGSSRIQLSPPTAFVKQGNMQSHV